jgi:hypothetical protein
MRKVFGLVRRGDLYLLRRLEYPHYKAWVDLSKTIPVIKEIIFLDKCRVSEMASALNEGGIFLDSYARETEESGSRQYQLAFFGIAFVLAYQLVSSLKILTELGLHKLRENRNIKRLS